MGVVVGEQLLKLLSPEGMAAAYDAAVARMVESVIMQLDGLRQQSDAMTAFSRVFVNKHYRSPVSFIDRCGRDPGKVEETVRSELKHRSWTALMQMTNMTLLMTTEDNRKLREQLEHPGTLPEVTAANITAWADTLLERLPEISNDAIREAWRVLCPLRAEHKTNQRNEGIGRKVIITSWLFPSRFGLRMYTEAEEKIQAVDKAFHLLDGKGLPKYPGGLLTALRNGLRTRPVRGFRGESEYFQFKVYGNGNVHLTIKDTELVGRINRLCGGNMVPAPTKHRP